MEKYSDDLVRAYVYGDDLENFDIDELENDAKFMIEVLKFTKDKKMYEFCSDLVKRNKELVSYIIDNFSDDIDFCKKVVQRYMYHLEDIAINENKNILPDKAAIAIKMVKNIKNDLDNEEYTRILKSIYSSLRVKIELEKRSADYNAQEDNLGYGFEYFKGIFGSQEEALKHFAIMITADILNEHKEQFEGLLHAYYPTYESVNDPQGEALRIIEGYDINLANYLCDNPGVLNKGTSAILASIKQKWNLNELNIERKQYDELLSRIHGLVLNTNDAIFNEESLLAHFGIKYNIIEKISLYDGLSVQFLELLNDEFNDVYFNSIMEYSTSDKKLYDSVNAIFKEVLTLSEDSSLKKELK